MSIKKEDVDLIVSARLSRVGNLEPVGLTHIFLSDEGDGDQSDPG